MDEIKQQYLEPESEHPTWDEMRAFVNSSLTGISQPVRVISQQIESAGYVENTDANEGKGWRFDAQGNLYANDGNFRGDITGASGTFSGTLSGNTIIGATIKTSTNAGAGVNSVIMDTDGIRGYDSVLGNTFNLPTDGSAPTFSSGVINEVIFEISTNAVLRTSSTVGDGSASSAGTLINNTGVYICEANQAVASANFKALVNGTISIKGSLTITGGTGIANLDGGDLVTVNEADVNALNLTNGPAAAGADVTGDNTAANITGQGDLAILSVIGNAYITDLAVSKLAAGTITSKAFTLAVSAGTGDAYFSGGAGLDYANWTADKGFILGIDDSDSDLAKFFIGDHANNKYFAFDGADVELVGTGIKSPHTAGESISAGEAVCIKNTLSDYTATEDAYVYSPAPNNNYGTNDDLFVKSGDYVSFIKFNLSTIPNDMGKVVLRVYSGGYTGGNTVATLVHQVTSAWTEGAVTWNNQPTTKSYAEDKQSFATATVGNWVEFDVTNLVRAWKNGSVTNYGLRLSYTSGGAGGLARISARESAGEEPHLRIENHESSDGKVYKAQDSATDIENYNLCRNVIGIAAETKSADAAIKVYDFPGSVVGKSVANMGAGKSAYVGSTAGELINDPTNAKHLTLVGVGTASGDLILKPERPYFIERYPSNTDLEGSAGGLSFADGTTLKLMPPRDAIRAVIKITKSGGGYDKISLKISRVGLKTDYTYTGNAIEQEVMRASWANDIITLTSQGVSASTYITAYYYSK